MRTMRQLIIFTLGTFMFLLSCNRNKFEHDASGTFEATEVIVSSEANGKLESFQLTEGDQLAKGQYVGYVDSIQLYLKKRQLIATNKAIQVKRPDISVQVSSIKEQIAKAEFEKRRIQRLLADNAATQKQLDDANSQIEVLKKSLNAQVNSLSTSVNSLNEESNTNTVQVSQIEDQLKKCKIINPIQGTVLNKFVEEKEVVTQGKALYKIADTKNLFLRAYIVSEQLEKIKIGQKVKVFINISEDKQKSYPGTITWISDKAEFTPKTIQTQDERQNLVYAVKIAVTNTDGLIKIGMYGDVDF
ncbi:HlyD family efflux transporter periplasmic adaptor subunit [Apibacter sp. B3924]|nr:HlyD family efflux transporter periplasmic adaptor subunit [Apibacter sp. B3924]MXO25945.1 HlyD family efflux transporter periplasmic adaptor subunit [Apibacter sp. B3813]MXO27896.1 HlyD family efflux transporter periplasmic adaptor subunit [Apibacter sp. B3913]MXO29744.1 HlyD family efflux transporter periplasmic adaptor subunit [Apibacter sp. B3912]MXP01178.1 HlyD family efflux transporter periplasmic adaptor subunit [Apibacter sp. B3918]